MKNGFTMVNKLQLALNVRGERILQRSSQFYSAVNDSPVTIYYVDKAYNGEDGKVKKNELFHSTSQLHIIFFLRDLLCLSKGEPLPTDNEVWNEKRKEIDYFKEQGVV